MRQIYEVRPSISPWKQNNIAEILLFSLCLPSVSDNTLVKSIYFSKSLSIRCKFPLHVSTRSVPTQLYHSNTSMLRSASCQMVSPCALQQTSGWPSQHPRYTHFRLTFPASAVHTLQDTKLSSQLRKRSSKSNNEPSCGCPCPCSYTWPTASISLKFGGTTWQPSFTARSKKQCLPRQLAPLSLIWAQLISAMILNYLG